MPDPGFLLDIPLNQLIGWGLLHSLWQGGVIALILMIALRIYATDSVSFFMASIQPALQPISIATHSTASPRPELSTQVTML